MTHNNRVIVGCSHGDEDPDRVVVSFLTAGAALDQGKEVVMWLTSEATASRFAATSTRSEPTRSLRSSGCTTSSSRRAAGSTSADLLKERELDETELVDNAELQGATPLMEFAGE